MQGKSALALKALRVVLPVAALFLAYQVFDSIAEPVREKKRIAGVEEQIKKRLFQIKAAQLAYQGKYKVFAPDFSSLIRAVKSDVVPVIRKSSVAGDSSLITTDTIYRPMYELAFPEGDVSIDSLRYVPLNPKGAQFVMNADIVYINHVEVPVFEVYDPGPPPGKMTLRLGSMTEPVYRGNWE